MLTLGPENVKQQKALEFSTDNFTQQCSTRHVLFLCQYSEVLSHKPVNVTMHF